MTRIVLFRKPNCEPCDALKNVLETYNIPFMDQALGELKISGEVVELPVMQIGDHMVENPIESIELTRLMLQYNVLRIVYTKKDGSTRVATGTLDLEMIPKEHHPKINADAHPTQVRYYDLDSKGWRSFNHDNLVQMGFV